MKFNNIQEKFIQKGETIIFNKFNSKRIQINQKTKAKIKRSIKERKRN